MSAGALAGSDNTTLPGPHMTPVVRVNSLPN
jgi:hypothetical protein